MVQLKYERNDFDSSLQPVTVVHGIAKNLGLFGIAASQEGVSPYADIDMCRVISADRVANGSPPLPPDVCEPIPGLVTEIARQDLLRHGKLLD